MYVRLAFAVAINVDPELLLIDEILAVGDVTFQQKCMEKFVAVPRPGSHARAGHPRHEQRPQLLRPGDLARPRRGEGRRASPPSVIDEYTETMLEAEEAADGSARRGRGPIRVAKVEILVSATRRSTGSAPATT